jgi:hypothetical protein
MHFGDISDKFVVDHINGLRNDNRIENLRLVSRKDNALNATYKKYRSEKLQDYQPKLFGTNKLQQRCCPSLAFDIAVLRMR